MQEEDMIRSVLIVAIALCLNPSTSYAQNPKFTVTAASASIYQAPSAASPVIAQSPKGAVLDVRGEVAGWIEVAWPTTGKGIAYVRDTTGVKRPMTIEEFVHSTPAPLAPASSPDSANPSTAYIGEAVRAVASAGTPRQNANAAAPTYRPVTHFMGIGARMAALTPLAPKLGVTGRLWSRKRVGVQLEIMRDATTNAATAERVTSLQFAPGLLYALPSTVSDYVWVRPYFGGGPAIYRSTLRSTDQTEIASSSSSALGLQFFGGSEFTFAGLPRFALSADAGYRRMPTGPLGFEHRNVRFALSGHWFVR
jgi:hypothetical protein